MHAYTPIFAALSVGALVLGCDPVERESRPTMDAHRSSDTLPERSAAPTRAAEVSEQKQELSLTGEWSMRVVIEESTYKPFIGLSIDYKMILTQDGEVISGVAEKIAENDKPIRSKRGRSPLDLSGTIKDRHVEAVYLLEGSQKQTTGSFDWEIQPDGNSLTGTFQGGNSRGRSVATRLPSPP